jgi:hypothetical protein
LGFPIVRMTCTRCMRTEPGLIYSRPRRYQVDNQIQLEMHYETGWCFDCDSVRHIEDLSPNSAIDAIRRAASTLKSATARRRWLRTGWDCQPYHWLNHGSKFVREFHTKDWHALGSELEEQADRLVFLSQRSAPAKCLRCFGQNVTKLQKFADGRGAEVLHPKCGGHFVVKVQGSMNIASPTTKLIYLPDGSFSHEEPYDAPNLLIAGRFD